ncbi:MAG: hypothetical protein ACOC44_17875, partial [Promethearchaeia archaeon]
LYRQFKYPVMRGTVLLTDDRKEALLFTKGYIPVLGTYPGHRVPAPIKVKKFMGNSDISTICEEVLKLSRLDWNTIKYSQKMPVTISFSKKVKAILAERCASLIDVKTPYRYYM